MGPVLSKLEYRADDGGDSDKRHRVEFFQLFMLETQEHRCGQNHGGPMEGKGVLRHARIGGFIRILSDKF